MKKKLLRTLSLIMALVLCAMSVMACGDSEKAPEKTNETQTEKAPEKKTEKLSGNISLAGSTSMEKVCEALMEGFMEKYQDITVTTEYTGSGAGLESLVSGSVDIGNASRHVKDSEKEKGATENVIALDGIAVITDKNNSVKDLSKEQLAQIYKGEIKNWSEIGGSDTAIVVIGRENGSGTRDAFEELMEVKEACKYAQELDSTGAVLAKVASIPGAIGYVSFDVVDDSVSAFALDGVAATEANILSGAYALQRPFVMATRGEKGSQNELVKTWFDYISSEEGKSIIKSVGLIIP